MILQTKFKIVIVGLVCTSLSACFGSSSGSGTSGAGAGSGGGAGAGSGGGSGGSGGTTDFDTNFEAAQLKGPTRTALQGSADYTGQVRILTGANAGNADEALVGDLDMNINFDGGSRPISATASNFAGEVDGTAVTSTGTLSTANAPSGVNAVTTSTVNIPGQGAAEFTGLSVELRGDLSESTGAMSGATLMTMQGNMVGDDGESAFGAAGVSIEPSSGGAAIITGGTWYADKD